jgi:hypothetical protein
MSSEALVERLRFINKWAAEDRPGKRLLPEGMLEAIRMAADRIEAQQVLVDQMQELLDGRPMTMIAEGKILDVEPNIFDEEEIHENCTVQILRNSQTDDISIGWWEGDQP